MPSSFRSLRSWCRPGAWALTLTTALLASCGGGGGASSTEPAAVQPASAASAASTASAPPSQAQAVRLASQATFGATEALVAAIRDQGIESWVAAQMALDSSRYTLGGSADIHLGSSPLAYCDQPAHADLNCWRDNMSTQPLIWDFYRNAVSQPDQLRQRVAFALQQILVVSNVDTEGTYGFRSYHNALLAGAFGNYRSLLRMVAVSPLMGDYLNNANNHRAAPNENFARELLQLFSLGTCELNPDGSLAGGSCKATYDNTTVREYARALTGWTYPPGGTAPSGCWATGANCRYYAGDMVPLPAYHDTGARQLLSGMPLPEGHDPATALERVLDSLMAHRNVAPFVARRLIQHLVTSNPSPAYVMRVSSAFASGRYQSSTRSFGQGQPGDLAATVAATLLDPEARTDSPARQAGRLRDPVLLFTGVLRALDGQTDGDALGFAIGGDLQQLVFRPPTVFSFYPSDYPVPGTGLVGPSFGIHNTNTALARLTFLSYLLDMGGSAPNPSVPAATGTKVDLARFESDATDAATLVDRLSNLAIGQPLTGTARDKVIAAVEWWTPQTDAVNWKNYRVRTAAYLVFAAPNYQIQR